MSPYLIESPSIPLDITVLKDKEELYIEEETLPVHRGVLQPHLAFPRDKLGSTYRYIVNRENIYSLFVLCIDETGIARSILLL